MIYCLSEILKFEPRLLFNLGDIGKKLGIFFQKLHILFEINAFQEKRWAPALRSKFSPNLSELEVWKKFRGVNSSTGPVSKKMNQKNKTSPICHENSFPPALRNLNDLNKNLGAPATFLMDVAVLFLHCSTPVYFYFFLVLCHVILSEK